MSPKFKRENDLFETASRILDLRLVAKICEEQALPIIFIPKNVFETLDLNIDDLLVWEEYRDGKIILRVETKT